MRNLILTLEQFKHIPSLQGQEVVGWTESDEKDKYFFATSNGVLCSFNLKTGQVLQTLDLKVAQPDCDFEMAPDAHIVGIQYVAELESVCIITDIGDIVLFNLTSSNFEVVGELKEGINAMAWSPEQEIVIFATGNDSLVWMSKEWEMLVENPIDSIPIKQKLKMDPNAAAIVNVNNAPKPKPRICWRADGKYFVVNSQDNDGKQWVRIWERGGNLFARNEVSFTGLDKVLTFRPDNSIFASAQYLANKNETNIVFFEKNGLQHYDFLLEKGKSTVHSIQWNMDSDLLSVSYTSHQGTPLVQLFYRGNYHWYMKQEFRFTAQTAPTHVAWDATHPHRLHIACIDGTVRCYDFCWDRTISLGNDKQNPVIAAVIDGNKLLLTPFRFANVPPPMSAATLETKAAAISCATFYSNKLAVLNSDNSLEVYKIETNPKPPKFGLPPTLLGKIESVKELQSARLLTLVSDNCLFAVQAGNMGEGDLLLQLNLNSTLDKIESISSHSYSEKIVRLFHHMSTNHTLVQTSSGSLFIQPIGASAPQPFVESFDHYCPQFAVCTMAGEEVAIGLTQRGVLYVNGNVASSNCSSFALHDQFLLFTTFAHVLRSISLQLPVHEAIEVATAGPSSKYDESFREIERGATLTCVIPQDFKAVLQMPRGNIEGIYPHALVLAHIRNLLSERNYREAVSICRKYKIDMNLIVDHNPSELLAHCEDFVKSVADAEYINLFLSSLANEDITKTRYNGYFNSEERQRNASNKERLQLISKKINTVCVAMRSALEKVDGNKNGNFISSILTTFARSDPPQLEEALTLIRNLRIEEVELAQKKQQQQNEEVAKAVNEEKKNVSADTALTYLIFLADVNNLYNIALGMYDFELVLMVAQKSQKDPKEYLPFIASLKKLETFYQRYTIDMHLERYESALKNLSQAAAASNNNSNDANNYFDECLKLIKLRALYKLAMQLFKQDSVRFNQVLELYGDYLVVKSNYKQAGYCYLQSKCLEKAQDAFIKCGKYKFVFTIARQLKQSKEEVKSKAHQMIEILHQRNKTLKIATVQRDYLLDHEAAILTLVKGNVWDEALRLATQFDRLDLIETHVRPEVMDAFKERYNELKEIEDKLLKYMKRLQELREERQRKLEAEDGEAVEAAELMDRDDALSDSGSIQSNVSGVSGYSGVSILSKASNVSAASLKRRQTDRSKKKRQKLKKGSPFEEENIVTRIYSLLPTPTLIRDYAKLQEALVYFQQFDEARQLKMAMDQLVKVCLENKNVIELPYNLESKNENNQGPAEVVYPKKVTEVIGKVESKILILE